MERTTHDQQVWLSGDGSGKAETPFSALLGKMNSRFHNVGKIVDGPSAIVSELQPSVICVKQIVDKLEHRPRVWNHARVPGSR
jgi:hypothetical protein